MARPSTRLLLLMTTRTYRAAAFLEAARRLRLDVVVGSERVQALAAGNPAGHLTLDFRSPEEATARVVAAHREHPLAAVIAADDDGVLLAATAAAALGLPHNPVAAVATARDKLATREALARAGLPTPSFWTFEAGEDPRPRLPGVTFPCVLKPRFLSGSRGVIRADDASAFLAAFRRLSDLLARIGADAPESSGERTLLVESYVPGVEVALEGILTDGELRVLALYDKPDLLEGPFCEETIYVTPSTLPAPVQVDVVTSTQRALEAIGLRSGPVHVELRVNEQGSWLLEAAPRSIGGLCSRTLRFVGATPDGDATLEELILRHALGEDVHGLEREPGGAGVMMIPIPREGVLQEVSGVDEARGVEGVEDVKITIPVGQRLVPLPEGDRYLGFIFARAPTPEPVVTALRAAHRRLQLRIEDAERVAS